MNAPWDAQQREWLKALGYEVMVPVTAPGVAVGDAVTPRSETSGVAVSRESAASAARAPATALADPLLRALAPAARCEDPERLAALRLDPGSLRTPAAKRALWPVLRRMRKARR